MAIIEVVKYDGPPGMFAWKPPDQELGTWTQLIVKETEDVEISRHIQGLQAPAFLECGIELKNFYIDSINIPDDDHTTIRLKEALAKKAEMDIIGFPNEQKTAEHGAAGSKVCSHCGQRVGPGAKFCTHCGEGVVMKWAGGGTEMSAGQKFCAECGRRAG